MSNEETGKLIDDVKRRLITVAGASLAEYIATAIVGELQSKYNLTPIGDTKEG